MKLIYLTSVRGNAIVGVNMFHVKTMARCVNTSGNDVKSYTLLEFVDGGEMRVLEALKDINTLLSPQPPILVR